MEAGRVRILIVDDDPPLLPALAEMICLLLWRVEVETCSDPRRAPDMARAGRYDLILCDLKMPHCNGLSLLPRLREASATTDVLVMSALDEADYRENVLALGALDFVQKPFDRLTLTARLKDALRGRAHI